MSYRDDFREAQANTWWTLPRVLLLVLVAVVSAYAIGFLATGGDLAIYRFWAPKQENARRVVFESTQSYVQGKVSYLSQLRLEYETAEPNSVHRKALRTMILTEASNVDNSQLPISMQAFIAGLKGSL